MGLIKPHLTEVPPVELSIRVKQGADRQRKFFTMPVVVHSETFKKALQFLIDHNYEFDNAATDDLLHEKDSDKKETAVTLAS